MTDKILPRLKNNRQGFLKEFKYLLTAVLVTGIADAVSTIHFMVVASPELELHPAIRLVSFWFGPVIGPITGKICQFTAILLITVYFRRAAFLLLCLSAILYGLAAAYNFLIFYG